MAAKAHSEGQGRGRSNRRREILGIFLLAFGAFAGLALISMHAGNNRMMGPGGAATAAGLYALVGVAAYLVVMGMLVLSWRAFRGSPLVDGFLEGTGVLMMISAVAVLVHLPFAGTAHMLRGPGGLLGQWLGEIAATFIGPIGAALAATAVLFVALMLVTEIRMREVLVVVAWALAKARHGIWMGMRAIGRLAVAMFPERDASERARDAGDDDSEEADPRDLRAADDQDDDVDEAHDEDTGRLSLRAAGRALLAPFRAFRRAEAEDAEDEDGALAHDDGDDAHDGALEDAVPSPLAAADTDGVRVGQARGLMDQISHERAAIAAIVAEVAAVERMPEAQEDEDEDEDEVEAAAPEVERPIIAMPAPLAGTAAADGSAGGRESGEDAAALVIAESPANAAGAPAPGAPGPIIVEPAWKARLRERAEARNAGAATAHASDGAAANDGPGFIKLKEGAFQLPATALLEYIPPQGGETDRQGLYDMAERLEQAMSNYGVRGKVKEIHMGPVVTMFEFAPAPGTRTGKIANLEKDLAMALEAQAVRIVAPIPGKAVVGVEVPNKTREMVYLREILEDDCFTKANSKLQVALGKDIKGAPVSVNLSKMPHLLVAGTTGSGKSVAVNGMIASLLYNASPDEVRFIMVDPKMLELSIYEGIPHLLLPVVTDPKKANLALRWAVDEMERRYELLAKAGVRDITGYNAKVETELSRVRADAGDGAPKAAVAASGSGKKRLKVVVTGADGKEVELDPDQTMVGPTRGETSIGAAADVGADDTADTVVDAPAAGDGVVGDPLDPEDVSAQQAAEQARREADAAAGPPPKKLPYIVIVIDEFADLMMVAPKDVETSVARIAQKARAAGLHLILATQRPSVDVITGLIKANFPSRIALQVASRIDSRTILDQPGADTLLGNGDMLFSDRGMKLRRVHGAFLGDEEVHRIVEHLKSQAKPVYDMDILKPREEDAEDGAPPPDDFHDDFYDQAIAIVCETRQASVSYIQRRLQIGYNRAARMVEQMERDGIVGPANGAKPREVLAPPGEYLQQAG